MQPNRTNIPPRRSFWSWLSSLHRRPARSGGLTYRRFSGAVPAHAGADQCPCYSERGAEAPSQRTAARPLPRIQQVSATQLRTKQERSGTLTKSSAKKGSSSALSPDYPRGEVHVGDVAKANTGALERRDGATARSAPQHDHARVPSQLRTFRRSISAEQSAGTNGRRSRSRRNARFSIADWKLIEWLLAQLLSPEQVSGRLREESLPEISHENDLQTRLERQEERWSPVAVPAGSDCDIESATAVTKNAVASMENGTSLSDRSRSSIETRSGSGRWTRFSARASSTAL